MAAVGNVIAVSLLLIAVVSRSDCCINDTCPTWFHESGGRCQCGSSLKNVIICNNETQEVFSLVSYCVTTDSDCINTVVAGRCFSVLDQDKTYDRCVSVNKSPLNQSRKLCSHLNRQGRLCGNCKPHHYVSAYSYDMKCYKCHYSLRINLIAYVTIAYVPLTVFLVLVLTLHISVASPQLSAAVLACQMFAFPSHLRYLVQITRGTKTNIFVKFFATVYGIWNLDFFRSLIPPICLPLNAMQMMALDYLVAVYPFIILTCFYVLLRAHDRGCRLVVRLWRPFLWCTARLRQQWNIRHSIIDAFATFFLLSYMKFLNTSIDLLVPTNVYDVRGVRVGVFWYYDATVEYMGPDHRLYAVLAILVLVIGVLFPLVFLSLYPMQWFQKCLNRCGLNSPGLQMFMLCFQGYYRDRTDGGRECRYFAAVYPAFRISVFIIYALTLSMLFFPSFALVIITVTGTLVLVRPYKQQYNLYNKLDVLMMIVQIVYITGIIMTFSFDQRQIGPAFGYGLAAVITFIPLVYFTVRLWKMMMNTITKRWSANNVWKIAVTSFTQRWARNVQQTPHIPDGQHYVNLLNSVN